MDAPPRGDPGHCCEIINFHTMAKHLNSDNIFISYIFDNNKKNMMISKNIDNLMILNANLYKYS